MAATSSGGDREQPEARGLADAWLVVIDHQVIFADPESDWAAPRFAETVDQVARLAEAFGERVVVTRWIPPATKFGSWGPYFQKWAFADRPATDAAFDLVPSAEALGSRHVVTEPTFGKWGAQLQAITGVVPHLVLAGVATDCCVVATAIPAADAGATVTVVSDASAGATDEGQQHVLALMAGFDPQIVVRTTAEVLAERTRG